jgi:hypothetical protein
MLGCVIIFSVYAYDRLSRWKMLYVIATASIAVTWLLRNATVDPADGYYRLMIWQNAIEYISRSPIVGAAPIS